MTPATPPWQPQATGSLQLDATHHPAPAHQPPPARTTRQQGRNRQQCAGKPPQVSATRAGRTADPTAAPRTDPRTDLRAYPTGRRNRPAFPAALADASTKPA